MLIAPRVLQRAIDAIGQSATSQELLTYAGLFLGVMVVQGIFRYYVRQTLGVVSRRIEYDIRNDIYRHIQRLTLSYFHTMRTGEGAKRIVSLSPCLCVSLSALVSSP